MTGEKGKKVLVTGAGGFIGSFLCPRLIKEGYSVTALDISETMAKRLQDRGMNVIIADLTRSESLKAVCRGMDVIIHLAAWLGPWGKQKKFHDGIYLSTQRLLEAIEDNKPHFVFFSSFCAAGAGGRTDHLRYHKEDDYEFKTGTSYYCDYKYEAEKLVYHYHDVGKVSATVVRPANVIGPGSVWVINNMNMMLKNPKYQMVDGGVYHAALIYVDNLVEGIMRILERDASHGRTYHFMDDYKVRWRDYIYDLAAMTGKQVKIVDVPFQAAWGLGSLNDAILRPLGARFEICRHSVGLVGRANDVDTTRARAELGWETRVPYKDAMSVISEWVNNVYLKK
jgi:nucleoside-diphosphate-sugar epimerase